MTTFQERVLAERTRLRRRRALRVCRVGYLVLMSAWGVLLNYRHHHRGQVPPANVVAASPETWEFTAKDGLPGTLVINGETWYLQPVATFVPESDGIGAETYCANRTIYYRAVTVPREVWRDDVMHELFHAGTCAHGGATWWNSPANHGEHPGIYHLGTFTAQLIHDNPELMAWVAR